MFFDNCWILKVLSGSVSNALKLTGGEDATETSKFVDMMDKFFDALNVHNYHHGIYSLKPFQMPYISASDTRLKVCMHTHAKLFNI